MLFNSLDFAAFLPIVWVLYWLLSKANLKYQNLLIVAASYLFYGWWDWRFLSLIFFSTLVDYLVGLGLSKHQKASVRKRLLWLSISVNLGLLGFFKYYNFFIESFTESFSFFGGSISATSLNIILPVGISFYTFQTLSYTIDTYRKQMEPTRDFISFMAFVSFFPQLVAGPIERASHLLPQFFKKRKFEYLNAINGFQQILWGLFKKMVIAENCAEYVNLIYANSDDHSGGTLLLAAVLFTVQMYGDFSGYSDIAIGTARLFGFHLRTNFAYPFFSRDFGEFWRRWHISLTTWFRDYLYIPLGGSRGGTLRKIRNIAAIFLVSGLWHGANWTFVIWGALHALFFIPLIVLDRHRAYLDNVAQGKYFPSFKEVRSMTSTFLLLVLSLIFFRSVNVGQAFSILNDIFSESLFSMSEKMPLETIALISAFMIVEWLGREYDYATEWVVSLKLVFSRLAVTLILIMSIILFMATKQTDFFYFQF